MTSANDFEMPGLMTPEAAARAIMLGFERGHFEIRFPKAFSLVLRVISMLPDRLRFALLHKTTGMGCSLFMRALTSWLSGLKP